MKKVLLLAIALMLVVSVFAEVDFYGHVRTGLWYDMQDEDFTESESRIDFDYSLYKNSRFGTNISKDNFKAKVEFGFSSNVLLRHLYGEYDFGKFNLLVGKTFTGFNDFASQTASLVLGYDGLLVGYGMMYDGLQNMVKISMDNGAYLALMQPKEVDPASVGGVDALMPKFNLGYKFKTKNLYIHPTLGVNMSKYNKDFAIDELGVDYDNTILAYVFATTVKYNMGRFYVKSQVNYAQNAADYGMLGGTISKASYSTDDEILNVTSFGGYGEFGYKLNNMLSVVAGGGYVASDRNGLDDSNTAMSAFVQTAVKLADNVMIVPEIGIIDNMEDGSGKVEGARTYFGTRLQMTFSTK